MRGAAAAALISMGWVGVAHSLALALRVGDPGRAHALAPWDGRVTAELAERDFADAPAGIASAARARLALRQDPTAVAAATTLGLSAQVRSDVRLARASMGYAQRLSRRDLQTQVWAIEDAVSRGDVAGALTHYDIALRTSKRAPDLLFPVLATAIADPSVRRSLVALLATAPDWGAAFVDHAASKGPDPQATAEFVASLRARGFPISSEATSVVVNNLIAAGKVGEAWRFYAAARPGAVRGRSRDQRFAADLSTPSAFDWTPINDAGVSASIQRDGRSGVFEFSVPASVGGAVLQQLQVLGAGVYRLEGRSAGIDQPEGSQPYWTLACRDGREVGRVVVPNSAQAGGVFGGRIAIPAGCPVQTLSLIVRASDSVYGTSGRIDRALLAPVE